MDVILPGGLWESGQRQRRARFRTVDGQVELELAEAVSAAANVPDAVTRLLAAALEKLGDDRPTPERVANLCVADRKQLMRLLDARLGGEARWHSARCRIPSPGFVMSRPNGPCACQTAPISLRWRTSMRCRVRVRSCSGASSSRGPWMRCPTPSRTRHSGRGSALIERVRATCPECGADNVIEPDPYPLLRRDGSRLLLDVHRIASHYHWSEAAILALPRGRRQRYLDLIDAARGMQS